MCHRLILMRLLPHEDLQIHMHWGLKAEHTEIYTVLKPHTLTEWHEEVTLKVTTAAPSSYSQHPLFNTQMLLYVTLMEDKLLLVVPIPSLRITNR